MQFAERMVHLGSESAFDMLAKAKRLEAQGRQVIHLEIGQPDFSTPANICAAAAKAIQDGYTGYAPAAGLWPLREAIAAHVASTRQVPIQPEQVIVTPGAKPMIFFAILALVNSGDEVICPNPGFPTYASVTHFVGAHVVSLPLKERLNFRCSLDDLTERISDRTKLLILNSPQNPTGSCLSQTDLAKIAQLAQEHDFYVLADEIYSRLLYDQVHHSILSQPGMVDRTIMVDGFSKTYAMTGWRLGYGIVPQSLADKIETLMINSNSCTCSFVQMAGVEALEGPQEEVEKMVTEFKQRRGSLVAGLNQIQGIQCSNPSGAFYAFPNVKDLPLTGGELADYLLQEAGVALLTGDSFGQEGGGYLRLSYANSLENLSKAIDRIQQAVASL